MKRIQYIDIAKLIGLALVCYCHIPMQEGFFHIWTYSFHMPLFFILSGMFLKPEKTTIKSVIKQLLFPFIAFNILALLFSFVLNTALYGTFILPAVSLKELIMSKYIVGPSWFLLSLFYMKVLCGKFYKYIGTQGLIAITILLLIIFYCTREKALWNIFSFGSTILGLPFYMLGFIVKKRLIKIGNISINKFIFIIILSCSSISNGLVGIHNCLYGNNMIAYLLFGIIGTILIIRFSCCLKVPQKILKTFMQGAIFYICMHTLMFEYILLIWNKLTRDFSGNTILEKIVVTILTFIVSYPIIRFMLKYTPFLLGKQIRK